MSVLSESTIEGARPYIRRVKERVKSHERMAPHDISVSIGMAEFDRASMKSIEDIIHAADADMYRAKAIRARESKRAASP